MKARVVNLQDRKRKSSTVVPIHEWDAKAAVMLSIEPGAVSNVACAHWTIDLDPYQRSYEVSVTREGWQHAMVFQGRPHPNETPEQAQRREGVIRFLNELLSASYGVPA